ncbi:MAG TPA: metalloregulator ArsR/SmtB family transcription factor [Aggregatilineales bacterium]|nr:metalloregulator ArsR/SmtB family transcription factor [Aggregatilineales bacterium]
MGQEEFGTLLNFLKALGNENRLKIIGILANGDCTVGELASALDLKEPTVSQHLMMLKDMQLVEVKPKGNYRYYSFNGQALTRLSKDIFSRERLATLVGKFEEVGDAYERKVLETFFDGERLTQIPASEKKLLVVVKWLADRFEYDVQYTEKQVNEILTRHHEDYALLRRELVDCHYLNREKGIYWRIPPKEKATEVDSLPAEA